MTDQTNPLHDALDTTKGIAAQSVPEGTPVGESVDVGDPIQDAINTTKEIAAKSVPEGTPGEPIPETHPIKDALETTKGIASQSVPEGTPTDEEPEGGVLQGTIHAVAETAKDLAGKAGHTIVNTAEKITHIDIDKDGTIGGKDA